MVHLFKPLVNSQGKYYHYLVVNQAHVPKWSLFAEKNTLCRLCRFSIFLKCWFLFFFIIFVFQVATFIFLG